MDIPEEVFVFGCVRSLKDRLHREHMVSIAEVGLQDTLNVARLGLALVGVGGAVAGVGLWRIVGIGITVAEIIAMITPDKRDDAEVAKWRAAYDEKMAATAAAGGVRAEIEREKDRLRESAAAKAANLDLNDPKYKG